MALEPLMRGTSGRLWGMEHDVTEDPGSWIWARWRGFGALLVIWCWGRVTVGHHVEVTPRAAGPSSYIHPRAARATWAFER